MIKIAPAAVISKYLEANSRFEGDLARTAIGLMEDGYQRQLAYKLRDGSFSPFGESDRRGSTWVTALVARDDEFLSHFSCCTRNNAGFTQLCIPLRLWVTLEDI